MADNVTMECDIMSLYRTFGEIRTILSEFEFEVLVSLEKARRIVYTRGARAYHHSLHYCIERRES